MKILLSLVLFLSFPFFLFSQSNATLDLKVIPNCPYVLNSSDGNIDFLVKLKANKSKKQFKRTPLNISLVIDHSGSMEGRKLEYVKKACNLIIDNLTPEDILSIVVYDSEVDVLVKSSSPEDKTLLKRKINNIRSGSSTNLSGGLLEGYSQVKSKYNKNMVNRVLLLSDGLANQGITDINELQNIVKSKYLETGIAVSSFGVGADFNENLMLNIAEFGNGNYYFIDSPDNIPQIFKKELDGLLSVVSQNTILYIDYPKDLLTLKNSYGYDVKTKSSKTLIDFNDVFSEDEKIVLLRFKKKRKINQDLKFNFNLQYDDVQNNYKRIKKNISHKLSLTENISKYKKSVNLETIKHRIIFLSNELFDEGTSYADKGLYEKAYKIISKAIKDMKTKLKIFNIKIDDNLKSQLESQEEYLVKIKEMKDMPEFERNILQKSQKNSNYKFYKNKSK